MKTRRTWALRSLLFATVPIGACLADTNPGAADGGDSLGDASSGGDAEATTAAPETTADTGSADGSDSGGPAGAGLPCDVDQLLADRCRSCHAGNPLVSATLMLTRDDMLADSISLPGTSVGVLATMRLAEGAPLPMPPAPASPVSTAERELFDAWVDAGMPPGDCTPDGMAPDPFDADPVCTTNTYWTAGLYVESPHMDPGRACIDCHTTGGGGEEEEGPLFLVAGTIYATAHEPDDCYGIDGPATHGDLWIEVSQPAGASVKIAVNAAGNFYLEPGAAPAGFDPPYLVKVVAGGLERPMGISATSGDCNSCHTQDGTQDAPGRIILP